MNPNSDPNHFGFQICLFGNEELSLRDMLRQGLSEDEMIAEMRLAIKKKKERHAGASILSTSTNRPMILIGG